MARKRLPEGGEPVTCPTVPRDVSAVKYRPFTEEMPDPSSLDEVAAEHQAARHNHGEGTLNR